MAEYKLKEGTDKDFGLRLSFNAAMYRNLFRKHNGTRYHDKKLEAEARLDYWLKENIEGLPDNPVEIKPAELLNFGR